MMEINVKKTEAKLLSTNLKHSTTQTELIDQPRRPSDLSAFLALTHEKHLTTSSSSNTTQLDTSGMHN